MRKGDDLFDALRRQLEKERLEKDAPIPLPPSSQVVYKGEPPSRPVRREEPPPVREKEPRRSLEWSEWLNWGGLSGRDRVLIVLLAAVLWSGLMIAMGAWMRGGETETPVADPPGTGGVRENPDLLRRRSDEADPVSPGGPAARPDLRAKPPETTTPAAAMKEPAGFHTLILVSYSNTRNSRELAKETVEFLEKNGYTGGFTQVMDGKWLVVCLGKYQEVGEAEKLIRERVRQLKYQGKPQFKSADFRYLKNE